MIGADVMSLLSVPVFIMEAPTTTLQKMSEILQYAELVDKACDEKDEDLRLAYICALAISTYSSNERVKKPFNPILGETWEMTLPGGGVYVSEQVFPSPLSAPATRRRIDGLRSHLRGQGREIHG